MTDPFEEITSLRKSHEELKQLLQKSLNQPPRWTIDSKAIAEHLSQRVPNPVDTLEQIQLVERNVRQTLNSFPKSIPIRGEFYGFTSKKTFFSYWGMLAVTMLVAFYFSFRASDDERLKEYKRLVEEFGSKNPKLANKYFGSWYERNLEQ
ncbi:hypothetical protein VB796_23445 [Arcicella sp. LKC2W]|uniref:hypothetical protein n=1 Tax=Arcicella sp. LKC2W TaxID=2984198 RepID=UPI002B220912|nr:hypothetical protein [Arcicella sp. LKC2W]MEA5462046.1 hypothetical protein [Arcicella sp. LKC2W]